MPLPRVAQATVLADASHFCNNVALTETKPVLVLSKQFVGIMPSIQYIKILEL